MWVSGKINDEQWYPHIICVHMTSNLVQTLNKKQLNCVKTNEWING